MLRGPVRDVEDALERTTSRLLRRLGRPLHVQVFPSLATDGTARNGNGNRVLHRAAPRPRRSLRSTRRNRRRAGR